MTKSSLYIAFMVNNEEYGIEISFAKEIIRIPKNITQVPNMPSFVEGIINLRGNVIPVVDLKKKFNLYQPAEQYESSRLLIIEFDNAMMGVYVDDITDIIRLDQNSMEDMSSSLSKIGIMSIKGVGKMDDRLILLLDERKLKNDIFLTSCEEEEII